MQASTWWWILAGALVASELLSGSFYLLMLGLGAAAGAVGAHMGLPPALQLAVAAVIGTGSALAVHLRRKRQASGHNPADLDLGQTVQVPHWGPDGVARVQYRGAAWSARLQAPLDTPTPGPHRIVAIEGTQLLLEKV
ncbi:NfeD family protein [Aquabacterium lacunae]|uniref:NfeD family protein n=1 Tax=Aquabacterium lacunae TaxID=2528630 RepID=A0A4Q9H333_9BURK|nr:NfeD family protein [Aquabacterium lacunae]TBO28765.1 NfeD family protein [Aquabacterium lacunae]